MYLPSSMITAKYRIKVTLNNANSSPKLAVKRFCTTTLHTLRDKMPTSTTEG